MRAAGGSVCKRLERASKRLLAFKSDMIVNRPLREDEEPGGGKSLRLPSAHTAWGMAAERSTTNSSSSGEDERRRAALSREGAAAGEAGAAAASPASPASSASASSSGADAAEALLERRLARLELDLRPVGEFLENFRLRRR